MAASKALSNCTIHLAGSWKGFKQDAIYKEIESNGGSSAKSLISSVTHLITTEADFGKPTPRVQAALDRGDISIVSIEWMRHSVEEGSALDASNYVFGSLPTTSKADGDASQHVPAASLQGTDDEDEKNSSAKRGNKRTRDGKAKGVQQKVLDDDEDENPGAKKKKSSSESDPQASQATLKGMTIQQPVRMQQKPLIVPVDEGAPGNYTVYIDKNGVIYDALLNQTNSGANNNKFYKIQILTNKNQSFCVWMRWGRVGNFGQRAQQETGDFATAFQYFDKKFKDKSGLSWKDRLSEPKLKKYTFLERNYEPDTSEDEKAGPSRPASSRRSSKASIITAESKLPIQVQQLMELIFDKFLFISVMAEMNYDANKLPLGKLSKRTLDLGYGELKKLAAVINDPRIASDEYGITPIEAIEQFTNRYYSYIPHAFGRNRPPLIGTDAALKREVKILESLTDMQIAEEIMKSTKKVEGEEIVHPADKQYDGLNLNEMTPLDHDSAEFKELEQYLMNTKGDTHYFDYKIEDIFRIERHGENDRFDQSSFSKIKDGDRRLLWHGSRATNFGGILSQGLRIAPPEAPVNGYMFDKGIYLADCSSKSFGYTEAGSSNGTGLLLLCEAELGKPMLELHNATYDASKQAKEKGSIATWGKGRTGPKAWKDAGCANPNLTGVQMPDTATHLPGEVDNMASLFYNEYICYDVAQKVLSKLEIEDANEE